MSIGLLPGGPVPPAAARREPVRHTAARLGVRVPGRDEAGLLRHLRPVKDQVERDVLVVAEAGHVNVVHRGISGRSVDFAVSGGALPLGAERR